MSSSISPTTGIVGTEAVPVNSCPRNRDNRCNPIGLTPRPRLFPALGEPGRAAYHDLRTAALH
jgi:hypothetical protein